MGEYARSLSIARACQRRWPDAAVHFILSREAPYATGVPFECTLLPSSPTFHTAQVVAALRAFGPDVVIFDNAGRTEQLRAAKAVGASVVFISARSRQRRKAFRPRWMRIIDEHWIAYPEFIAGSLNWLERAKLSWLKRPAVRYLDVIMPPLSPRPADASAESYVLLVPGGGTGHPNAADAVQQFLAAAQSLAGKGIDSVFVGPIAAQAPDESGKLTCLAPMPQDKLLQLMQGARLIIANGGSTLLQGIACGVACIGVPIAKDQGQRIDSCVSAQLAVAAELNAHSMAAAALQLWENDAELRSLRERARAARLADGNTIAVEALTRLCQTSS
jgi:hypothetical protein